MRIPTIYLAGPDVFRPDAVEYGRKLVSLCAEYGFTGIFPLDASVDAQEPTPSLAERIYEANIASIRSCDAVVANLDFFRGPEPDSGTCFEVGFAVALGKPVVGYLPDEGTFAERIRTRFPECVAGELVDADGLRLEEFGLPLNLMLANSCSVVVGDIAAALRELRSRYA